MNFPTAIKFTPNGDVVVVGFDNGEVLFYDCKVSNVDQNISLNRLELISLEPVSNPVLSMEFSEAQDCLAISYGILA